MTKIFLTVVAVILMIFGVLYLVNPYPLMEFAGLQGSPSGLSDVRATYGGFQIGLAIFLLWSCTNQQRFKSALLATLCIFASVGLARLTGIVVDGEVSTFNLIGLCFEALLTLFLFNVVTADGGVAIKQFATRLLLAGQEMIVG